MSPRAPALERWERVHDALQDALDRNPAARVLFLGGIARHDPDLYQEVESLIRASAEGGAFDALVDRFVVDGEAVESLPSRIGAYRPIRLLARGGMGAVYLAERGDGVYEQRVAIKVLPAGTRADLHSRFLAERRIVARLHHPNIARLLDGGTTQDGLPYLVLEYVDGEPLATFCDRSRLSIERRVRLFLDVCAAVSYAHASLVVHRDIKPANVLVTTVQDTNAPCVKLLDFGIARLLDDDASADSAVRTRTGLRLLTPDYAAPEQVRGEAITTATDVWQLGVLLYELVSGRKPHASPDGTLRHIEHEICDRTPTRPSVAFLAPARGQQRADATGSVLSSDAATIAAARASSPKRLAHTLAGDLDTIVLHALAKEADRRYASVEAFAADVRRYLEGRPVLARPDTFVYRAGKFVRRNRASVVVALTIVLLLGALGVSTALQNRIIQAERDRAEQAAGFVTGLLEELEPAETRGKLVDAREILDRATSRVESDMRAEPLLQARLFDVLGRVYQMRGFFPEAESLLRRALEIRIEHSGPQDLDVAASRATLAGLFTDTDRHADAAALLAAAAATLRAHPAASRTRLGSVEIDQALARRAAGDAVGADSILRDAIRTLRDEDDAKQDLATALLYLGKVRMEQGDTLTARPLLEEALDIRRALFGEVHPVVANALDGMGELDQARGDGSAAERTYRRALAIRRELFPADHPDIGVSFENIGIALERQARHDEAIVMLDSALAILRPAFPDGHLLIDVAIAYRDTAVEAR
jgi:eukaryotic-like serine/threonine-protein kinase